MYLKKMNKHDDLLIFSKFICPENKFVLLLKDYQKRAFRSEDERLFIVLLTEGLVVFSFSNDSFESFWVVHCEVSENFTVHSDTSFVQCAHKL